VLPAADAEDWKGACGAMCGEVEDKRCRCEWAGPTGRNVLEAHARSVKPVSSKEKRKADSPL
jgi:hypothetical protein